MTLTSDNTVRVQISDDLRSDREPNGRVNVPRIGDRDPGGLSSAIEIAVQQAHREGLLHSTKPARRIQRREFKDYQSLFILLNSLDIIDEATRRDFVCIHGPVWQRYNEATKGATARRITVLFLGDENNGFDDLFLVACSSVRRRQLQSVCLWNKHPLAEKLDEAALRHVCHDLEGRSVLTWQALVPWLREKESRAFAMRSSLADASKCLGTQA